MSIGDVEAFEIFVTKMQGDSSEPFGTHWPYRSRWHPEAGLEIYRQVKR